MAASYWFEAVPEEKRFLSLEGNLKVDTVVVGGGIAGLTAAYLLSKNGVKVALAEQGVIAAGDSGYTTAFISRFLDNAEATKKTWDAGSAALQYVEDIVQNENLDCEFRRVSSLYFTKKHGGTDLKREFEVLAALDGAPRFLEKPTAQKQCSFGVEAAMHVEREGQFHIRKYLSGIARAMQERGAAIFEETPVVAVEDQGRTVRCKNGVITTERTVIATGMPTLFPRVAELVTPYLTFVIGAEFEEPRPFGEYLFWDDEEPYHYFRWVNSREVIAGGEDRLMRGPKPAASPHEALAAFIGKTAGVNPSAIVHRWQGSIFATGDSLPYYGAYPAYGNRIYFATGFGGNGMTFGALAGVVISDMILGNENRFAELFSFNR